jgi:peptidoglycan/LPS O-acetylase OafA/YrhL
MGATLTARLHTIDAMRGVAAIFVLVGHSVVLLGLHDIPRFWLSVDLFFLISGYVLGGVYEPRFRAGLTPGAFLVARLLRLYPLYLLGLAIGLLSGAITLALGKGDLSAGEFAVATVTGLVMLPSPTWAAEDSLFPLNFPAWSLFFELCANLILALCWRRLTQPVLIAIVILSAIAIAASGSTGHGEGWSSVWWGFPRVGFSFFLGILLHRWKGAAPSRRSPRAWLPVAAVVLLLVMTKPGGFAIDLLTIFVAFPLLVWFAATIAPPRPVIAAMLGALSYPLYVIHVPLLSLVMRGAIFLGHPPEALAPWGGLLTMAAFCATALWLDRAYDAPVRRFASSRLQGRIQAALKISA